MDQPVEPTLSELDAILDRVTERDGYVVIPREGKQPVVVMSVAALHRLDPPPQVLQDCWARAKELGLDTMTMDEIDAEIAAYRLETKAAAGG